MQRGRAVGVPRGAVRGIDAQDGGLQRGDGGFVVRKDFPAAVAELREDGGCVGAKKFAGGREDAEGEGGGHGGDLNYE